MNRALFIEEEEMKQDSLLSENIDGGLIKNLIYEAQEMYILPLLGSRLYQELQDQITSGSSAITEYNYTLLADYIQPALKRYTTADAYVFLNFRLTNKAVSTSNSQYSTAVDISTGKELHSMVKEKAEFFGQRMVAYLRSNTDKYPLYLNNGIHDGELSPDKSAYFCGIYFPRTSHFLTNTSGLGNESNCDC